MRRITRALLTGPALPFGPVVDLGCGGGAMPAELAHQFPDRQVHGLDLHPAALQQASSTRTATPSRPTSTGFRWPTVVLRCFWLSTRLTKPALIPHNHWANAAVC